MSNIAIKLFNENKSTEENYLHLLNRLFGTEDLDPKLNDDPGLADLVEDALYELDMSHPLGDLQHYVIKELYIHGKSKEEIGREIAENMALLLSDLENSAISFLRKPNQSKEIHNYLRKKD